MRTIKVGLAGVVLLAIGGLAKADDLNLVVNGGFESGNFSGWTLTGVPSYSLVAGFKAGSEAPHTGTDYAMLGSFGTVSYLSQTLATDPGADYNLNYYLASSGGMPSEFSVTVGTTLVSDEINAPKSGYVDYNYNFVATSDSTLLQFGERNDPGYWLLDDVTVIDPPATSPTAVPLPKSIWMAALPMLALGGFRFVRRQPA